MLQSGCQARTRSVGAERLQNSAQSRLQAAWRSSQFCASQKHVLEHVLPLSAVRATVGLSRKALPLHPWAAHLRNLSLFRASDAKCFGSPQADKATCSWPQRTPATCWPSCSVRSHLSVLRDGVRKHSAQGRSGGAGLARAAAGGGGAARDSSTVILSMPQMLHCRGQGAALPCGSQGRVPGPGLQGRVRLGDPQ